MKGLPAGWLIMTNAAGRVDYWVQSNTWSYFNPVHTHHNVVQSIKECSADFLV